MITRLALKAPKILQPARQPAQFSTSSCFRQKYESSVQTPLQSQNKDSITTPAARPEAEAPILETPVGKQRREALVPPPGQYDRGGTRAVYGLMAGVITVPPLVYYYYQQRREHMDNKRANLMEQQRQKYASGG